MTIHNARVEVNNDKLWVICSCGKFTANCGPTMTLAEFTMIHATHLDNAKRYERNSAYVGVERRRQARPVTTRGQQEADRPPTPTPARSSLPAAPPPVRLREDPVPAPLSLPSDLTERLERLERMVLVLAGAAVKEEEPVTNYEPGDSAEEIRAIWSAVAEPSESKLTCKCDGPEHEETCYKRYS